MIKPVSGNNNGEIIIAKSNVLNTDELKNGKKAVPTNFSAKAAVSKTTETSLVETENLEEDFTQDDTSKTETAEPRVVTVSKKPSEKQQEKIDGIVDMIKNKDYGFKDLEVTDNVIYQDENGNKIQEKIVKENEDGEIVSVVIDYDENGRIKSVWSQKTQTDDDGNKYTTDGEKITFKYDENGEVTMEREYIWGQEGSKYLSKAAVYIAPVIIDAEGKIKCGNDRLAQMFNKTEE